MGKEAGQLPAIPSSGAVTHDGSVLVESRGVSGRIGGRSRDGRAHLKLRSVLNKAELPLRNGVTNGDGHCGASRARATVSQQRRDRKDVSNGLLFDM